MEAAFLSLSLSRIYTSSSSRPRNGIRKVIHLLILHTYVYICTVRVWASRYNLHRLYPRSLRL